MKKIITTISACLISFICFSQTFSVTADTVNITAGVSSYPTDYIYFTNNSGGPLNLSFDVFSNTIPDAGWAATLCTDVVCMPTIPSTFNFGTYANGGQGFLNMHVYFNDSVGSGEISFKIYETSNSSNFRIVYFRYIGTSVVGIETLSNNININTFPNPTTNVLNISGLGKITAGFIDIYNLSGSLISTKKVTTENQLIDVSEFASGTYIVSIKNKGELVFTSRFIKK